MTTMFAANGPNLFVFDLAAKATLLLLMALVLFRVFGRRWPLLASAVGNASLIGLVLLPFSAAILPSRDVAWLPASQPAQRSTPPSQSTTDAGAEIEPAPSIALTTPTISVSRTADRTAVPIVESVSKGPAESFETDTETAYRAAGSIAIGMYAVGTFVFLIRLAGSLASVRRLRAGARVVHDELWVAALARLSSRLRVRRPVALLAAPCLRVPVCVGWLRPALVLPQAMADGDGREADAVALHELAHVKRGDYAWNVFLRVVQAVYWLHPLVWRLGRAIAEVRERACDDLCVFEMGGPLAYRDTLLAIASRLNGNVGHQIGPAIGLAMARRPKLVGRLDRLEGSRGLSRCLARWPMRVLAVLLAAAVASGLGVARLTRADVDDPKSKAASDGPRVFKLTVVSAETGKPVPNAQVRVWIALSSYWTHTDDLGQLDIRHHTSRADTHVSADIWGDGFAAQRRRWGRSAKEPMPDAATVKLHPGEILGGIVRNENGDPVAGAEVFLWSHNYKKTDSHEILYDLRAVTGSDGRWKTSGAPKTTGELLGVRLIHPDYLSTIDYTSKDIIPTIADLRDGNASMVMKHGIPIEGEILDSAAKPVENARIRVIESPMILESESYGLTKTDAKGRFRSRQLKAGTWHVVVVAKGSTPAAKVVTIDEEAPPYQIIHLEKPRVFRTRDGSPGQTRGWQLS